MIRLLSAEDYEQIAKLWSATPGMGLRSLDDSYECIAKFLLRNPLTCFVYEENGSIVGTVLCGHDGRRGYLYHLAVSEACRNKGIGTHLVNSVCEALRDAGIHKAALVVYADNEGGNAFWESLGWKEREDLCYRNKSLNEANQ